MPNARCRRATWSSVEPISVDPEKQHDRQCNSAPLNDNNSELAPYWHPRQLDEWSLRTCEPYDLALQIQRADCRESLLKESGYSLKVAGDQ